MCPSLPAAPAGSERLATNGLGGYAFGTVHGPPSRRYHGLLIAALPQGRTMVLNRLDDGLSGFELFRRERGLPVWRYAAAKRRIAMAHGQNVTVLSWRARQRVTLRIRPWFQFRPHGGPVDQPAQDLTADPRGRACAVGIAHLTATAGEWRAIEPQT